MKMRSEGRRHGAVAYLWWECNGDGPSPLRSNAIFRVRPKSENKDLSGLAQGDFFVAIILEMGVFRGVLSHAILGTELNPVSGGKTGCGWRFPLSGRAYTIKPIE